MPDITMCKNESCPVRKTCYRYMAKPTPEQQSYAIFLFLKKDDRVFCPHYKSTIMKELKQKLKNFCLSEKAEFIFLVSSLISIIAAIFTIVYLMMNP